MATYKIHLKDFKLQVVIGVNPKEQDAPQLIILQLTLSCELPDTKTNLEIGEPLNKLFEHRVDYDALYQAITTLVTKEKFLLLEDLAEAVVNYCLTLPNVIKVSLLVEKPNALLGNAVPVIEWKGKIKKSKIEDKDDD